MPTRPGPRSLRRRVLDLLLLLLLVYAGLCALVWLLQRQLLYHPHAEHVATPAAVGLDYEDVWLEPEPGLRVHAWFVDHDEARGTVLFLHGNAGNVSNRLDTLRMLHGFGLATLIPDYPGYGRSDGSPSEASILATGQAALRWLRETRALPSKRLVLWGRSLGGAIAACLAPEAEAAGLIVESSFPSVGDMARRLYPWLPTELLLRDRFDATDRLRGLAIPKLVLHSSEDETVPFELGRRLHDEAAEPKRFVTLHGSHDEGFLISGEAYRAPISSFLDALLGTAAGSDSAPGRTSDPGSGSGR